MGLLSEVKGWTPIIDAMTIEFGLVTAAVYGVVWRYCQMDDRVCRASLEVIGDHLNLNKATVMRHIKILCDNGYLKDLTPDRRNAPHVYADAGKVKIRGLIEATPALESKTKRGQTVAENNSYINEEAQTVAHNNSSISQNGQTVAECNATVALCNATVAESKLKKDSKRVSKKDKREASPPPAIEAIRSITHRYPDKATWPLIVEKVGQVEQDITFLKEVVTHWIGCGFNKLNVVGMLDFYERRELPGGDRNGHKNGSGPGPYPKTKLSPEKLTRLRELQAEDKLAGPDKDFYEGL